MERSETEWERYARLVRKRVRHTRCIAKQIMCGEIIIIRYLGDEDMECLKCGEKTKVTDSIRTGSRVLRRRQCEMCGKVVFTEEVADMEKSAYLSSELYRLQVQKKRGKRV